MEILNLIRWKNLLMIAVMQWLVKFSLLTPMGITGSLTPFEFILLMLATVSIAAAGNIINDVYDVETDVINKPNILIIGKSISEKTAYNLFIICNVFGVGLGYYLSHTINRSGFFTIFVFTSALLYIYSTFLKRLPLIGNIIISALVALSILIVGVFELLPLVDSYNQSVLLAVFKIILNFSVFAFSINLIREISKDLEDIQGDQKTNMNTLPIAIGVKKTKVILILISAIVCIGISNFVIEALYKYLEVVLYFLLLIIGPLLLIIIKMIYAQNKEDYSLISKYLKWVMLLGMLSLLLYKYYIL
ncbi:geranylgeranylglycerol-phosphate geranylgeranyltransferase [Gaetbulibacter saemankumensis]|uniref:geranylgeranylglycerol-phosphate geranylgeranyltransferase n=1 Tax=Gaetbulibacter saemankumensis TaxID=311208 RepID=UPI0009FBB348|nr:geranylgeranylglycerol-phosphate geranylgeranyltransferase [Gaetbulibacter saemankumensis]